MTSGLKSIVINTMERAVSSDTNRAQSLATRGLMESLRWLMDVPESTDDANAAGNAYEILTPSPGSGNEVLGGLMVQPNQSVLTLGITNGLACIIDPDPVPSTDDSPYKYVQEVGNASVPVCTRTPGNVPLALVPNLSSQPRIDVVECQRIQDPNPEVDSRDVFNPTTGVFTATSVTKTTGSVFQYQVNQGSPGSGFPGVTSGWMALAVVLVPPGATSNDDCTFWDVRPMVMDRIFGTANVSLTQPRRTTLEFNSDTISSNLWMTGIAEASENLTRLGGILLGTNPDAADTDIGINFSDAQNQDPNINLVSGTTALVYFYYATPFNLPRWARYTTGYPRLPRSPRGLSVVSQVGPQHGQPYSSSGVEMPAAYGFNGATIDYCTCWGASTITSGVISPVTCADGWQSPTTPVLQTGGSISGKVGSVVMTENVQFPASAKKIRATLFLGVLFPSSAEVLAFTPKVTLGITGSTVATNPQTLNTAFINGNGSPLSGADFYWDVEFEVPNKFGAQAVATPQSYTFAVDIATQPTSLPSGYSFALLAMTVTGWKF